MPEELELLAETFSAADFITLLGDVGSAAFRRARQVSRYLQELEIFVTRILEPIA